MSTRPIRRTLVINEPTRVQKRRRQSAPLIPPTINFNVDSSPSGEEVTLNLAPKMLLPPNTMEVVISGRRAEMAANQEPTAQPSVSRGSGPLIPPKLW